MLWLGIRANINTVTFVCVKILVALPVEILQGHVMVTKIFSTAISKSTTVKTLSIAC